MLDHGLGLENKIESTLAKAKMFDFVIKQVALYVSPSHMLSPPPVAAEEAPLVLSTWCLPGHRV